MLMAIDAGAENFEAGEDYYEITTTPEDFSSVREALEKEGLTFAEADVQMVPQTYISLDEEHARKMGLLIENLEDLDDVIEVYQILVFIVRYEYRHTVRFKCYRETNSCSYRDISD